MRQAEIWNAKAAGLRPVLDANEQPIDTGTLSERELVFAILRWSALPGASRHHWVRTWTWSMPRDSARLRIAAERRRNAGRRAFPRRCIAGSASASLAGRAPADSFGVHGTGCDVAPEPGT